VKRRTPLRASLETARAWERRSRRALPVRRRGTPPELRDRALLRDGGCMFHVHNVAMLIPVLEERPCWGRLDPHHLWPRGRGGPDELGNLITLCRRHHDFVHGHPAWATDLGLLRGPDG